MSSKFLINGLKDVRILQKKLLHQKELTNLLKEFDSVKLPVDYKKEIDAYWKKYNLNVSGEWHRFYYAVSGIEDVRFIGNDLYYSKIIYKLNRSELCLAYEDKNRYDVLFGERLNMPETIVRNINGTLYDKKYNIISENKAVDLLLSIPKFIVKPTIGLGGGKGISVVNNGDLRNKTLVLDIIRKRDVVIQKFINQHPILSKYNTTTVNTIRVMTLLWKGEVHILAAYFRVGYEGMDYVECHTYKMNIFEDGSLGRVVNDHEGYRKPNENHKYADLNKQTKLPCISKIFEIVKNEHIKLGYFKLIGWDFTVDDKGEPVFIEINTSWPAIDSIQMVKGPVFGELTDEIAEYVFSDKEELKKSIYIGI